MNEKERQLSSKVMIQKWTLNLNWSDKKVKTKNILSCFEINPMFRTSAHGLFPDLSRACNLALFIEGIKNCIEMS